jgi:outer membrane lipoprotein-sorting protein
VPDTPQAATRLSASSFLAGALLALALPGCLHADILAPASSPPDADAVLARMHASFACASAVQASAKVDHYGEHGRVRGELMLFAARPARVRLDVVSPFGVAVATLTSDGERFALADLRDKRFYIGPASACNIARATTVPVPGPVLVSLLQGEAPVLKHVPHASTMTWSTDGYWTVAVPSTHGATEEIRLAPRPEDWPLPWDRQRLRVLDVKVVQQGYLLYHAELSDHAGAPTAGPRLDPDNLEPPVPPSGPTCDAEVPRKIHLEVPAQSADVRFQYTQVVWNPPLPAGTFDQPPRPGMPIEMVTCE